MHHINCAVFFVTDTVKINWSAHIPPYAVSVLQIMAMPEGVKSNKHRSVFLSAKNDYAQVNQNVFV